MRHAINQYLKARTGFKLKERDDDPMDIDFDHKEGPKGKEKRNDKGKGKSKGKSKGKRQTQRERKEFWERQAESRNVPKNAQKLWQDGHKWSECWSKGGGVAKQVNSVGETEKSADVNWIMMIQQVSGHETWRCSGTSVSCKNAHESQAVTHAESDFVIPIPTQQDHFRHSRAQSTTHTSLTSDLNPANPVILFSRARCWFWMF